MYAGDRASRRLGFDIVRVEPGYAEVRVTVGEEMLGVAGHCDPGVIFTLADTAFAYACNTYNLTTVASACNIDLLGIAPAGAQLKATARERWRSGRNGVYDVDVTCGDDQVIAVFRGKSVSLKEPIIKDSEQEK